MSADDGAEQPAEQLAGRPRDDEGDPIEGGPGLPLPEVPRDASAAPDDRMVDPPDTRPDVEAMLHEPLQHKLTVRAGVYAWALIGLVIVAIGFGFVIATLSSVVIPLVIALFPAAVLQPVTDRLKRVGVPDALAALVVVLGTFGVVGGIIALIAPAFADQVELLGEAIRDGYEQFDAFLARGPFDLQDLIDAASMQVGGAVDGGAVADNALGFARAFFTTATSFLLMLIAVFFYLKDGRQIAGWVKSVFPQALHEDVDIIGRLSWQTIGGYIQGQLLVALVDAVFIGIGLVVLGVDLALPLAVIVFFGGLFPIVGATAAGFLATIVALASNGPGTALLVIVLVLLVQNLEGQLLQPLILGRALSLHPLAIICSLAVGGFLLGILGAFLAVPVAAASAQTIGYLRKRIPG
jgi:putative heme transporter